ncbi:MAG: hypothetical protein HY531_02785 [Chloroflexi bacterium]|nr:hypothetical protein [Chloroflexota bacterium]
MATQVKTPAYIQTLLKQTPKPQAARKVWSVDLENVWVPFFTATNASGATSIPSEDLGAPLRLAKTRDGLVRFSQNGRPTLRVAPALNDQIGSVRENFIATLVGYTGQVIKANAEGYKAEVEKAHKAAAPIVAAMAHDLTEATRAMDAVAEAEKVVENTPEAEKVAA